jgi:hypothetical protein
MYVFLLVVVCGGQMLGPGHHELLPRQCQRGPRNPHGQVSHCSRTACELMSCAQYGLQSTYRSTDLEGSWRKLCTAVADTIDFIDLLPAFLARSCNIRSFRAKNQRGVRAGMLVLMMATILIQRSQGLPAQELMLNYKQMGTERVPVWILLRIEPLRDAEGHLRYYLGHQFCRATFFHVVG